MRERENKIFNCQSLKFQTLKCPRCLSLKGTTGLYNERTVVLNAQPRSLYTRQLSDPLIPVLTYGNRGKDKVTYMKFGGLLEEYLLYAKPVNYGALGRWKGFPQPLTYAMEKL